MNRKVLKTGAFQSVKGHYFVLAALAVVMILFGSEYGYVKDMMNGTGIRWITELLQPEEKAAQEDPSGKTPDPGNYLNPGSVLSLLLHGQFALGFEESKILEQRFSEINVDQKMLARSEGVLASIVNSISSGRIFVLLAQSILALTNSEKIAGVIFSLSYLTVYLLFFVFVKSVYTVAMRRVYLEAGTYEKVSFMELFHIKAVKRWGHVALVLLLKNILESLWWLTIVGGMIKHYSYFAVPYLAAENPDIKARDAIDLSRHMMNGHKWELFKLDCSLLGWFLLSFVTLGFSDLLFGVAYREAIYAGYFSYVRQQAFKAGIEGIELLDDIYLYEKADRIMLYETYFDVVDELTFIHENRIELTGVRRFVARWFSIWAGSLKQKKQYDEMEGRRYAIRNEQYSMEQVLYPLRLNTRIMSRNKGKKNHFTYMRSYSVWTLFLLFILFSCVGWLWEVSLHLVQTGELVNRGTLHGPWLPIYGSGGVVALLVCSRFRSNPILEFLTSTLLCGCIEYFSGLMLEMKYHQRWWSYDGYFLNLDGRICAEGLLVFGVACCLVVYLLAPMFDYLLSRIRIRFLVGFCAVLGIVFLVDVVYAHSHPNVSEGVVEKTGSIRILNKTPSACVERSQYQYGGRKTGFPAEKSGQTGISGAA